MKFRTSLYTIFISLENIENEYILVHGYTGAIDKVAGHVAEFLKSGKIVTESIEANTLPISKSTFDTLVERGYLTSLSPLEEREKVKELANVLHKRDKKTKGFLFLVAYDCNFRCPYCFENQISANGKGWSKKVFTKQAVDRAYEAMLELEPDTNFHSKKIALYGGEPLLKQNKEIVTYIVNEGKKRGYSFSAVTNGYDLEHFQELLNPKMIMNLQISFDGSKEKHNQRRTHFSDGGSYDKIVSNMMMCLQQGVKISVRINTDLNNFDDLKLIQADFKQKGFFEYNNFSVYSALVHGADEMNCNAIMKSNPTATITKKGFEVVDLGRFDPEQQYVPFEAEQERYEKESQTIVFHDESFEHIDKIHTMNRGKYVQRHIETVKASPDMHTIACQDFGVRNRIKSVLEGKGLMEFRSVFCGAQTGMMIFDPYGDLYTCWELVGMDTYKVGTYRTTLQLDQEELENWYGRNIGKTTACSSCKYAFFCGGGCQAHALTEGRGYDSPYCDGYPKTFQKIVPDVYREFIKKQNQ